MRRPLPSEVYYSYVLPDLLSEHLHRFLLYSEKPEWNPFYILPLVSKDFRASCRTLCMKIFGLTQNEGGSVINHILDLTKELWDQANLDPINALPIKSFTYEQLMSSHSLIQAYLCTAVAKCFLNCDVLLTIELETRWNNGLLDDVDEDELPPNTALGLNPTNYAPRRFRIRDDTMHRVYLPLTCALKLCDRVRPERVAYILADYLSGVVPTYAAAPLMLKYSQDLDTYVTGEYTLNLTLVHWTSQTLGLIKGLEKNVIGRLQRTSKLVKSFNPSSSVPMEVIHGTNIIAVLEAVANADWGLDTKSIHDLANRIKRSLSNSCIN